MKAFPTRAGLTSLVIITTALMWLVLLSIRDPDLTAWHLGMIDSHYLFNATFIVGTVIINVIGVGVAVYIGKYFSRLPIVVIMCYAVATSYFLMIVLAIVLSFTPISYYTPTGKTIKLVI